jgi:hypothetical protein
MQQGIRISARSLPSELAATEKNYWDGGVVSAGAVAGDSVVVVVSDEAVAVGLAPGATVSVFRSQAARIPTAKTAQTYFFMSLFVTEALVEVKTVLGVQTR